MGATEFGFNCLQKLLRMKENIVAIYTLPKIFRISVSEKPLQITTHKDFRGVALKKNIPLIEVNRKMKDYTKSIESFKPDFILVCGWYYMIPKIIRDIPILGCACIHASLLPKYRGWAPLVWAIINGEKKTGVSFFYLAEKVDSGDIIAQKEISITKKDTIKTIYQKVTKASLKILGKYIPLIEKGKVQRVRQNEDGATYFPMRSPEDGLINWNKNTLEIYNWIRAQTKPYPGAFFFNKEGQKIKVWSAKLFSETKKILQKPGTILSQNKKEMKIATGNGYITITNWEVER